MPFIVIDFGMLIDWVSGWADGWMDDWVANRMTSWCCMVDVIDDLDGPSYDEFDVWVIGRTTG